MMTIATHKISQVNEVVGRCGAGAGDGGGRGGFGGGGRGGACGGVVMVAVVVAVQWHYLRMPHFKATPAC